MGRIKTLRLIAEGKLTPAEVEDLSKQFGWVRDNIGAVKPAKKQPTKAKRTTRRK